VTVILPKRPTQHVTGDRALIAVWKIFADLGHAPEIVRQDYGEDLIVQIRRDDGQLDSARLWVQVRGTNGDFSHRTPATTLKAGQVNRWAEMLDTVIVVLWHVEDEIGWMHLPDELGEPARASMRLRFQRGMRFFPASAELMVERARLLHLARRIELVNARARRSSAENRALHFTWMRAAEELKVLRLDDDGKTIHFADTFWAALCKGLPGFGPGETVVEGLTSREVIDRLMNIIRDHYRQVTGHISPPAMVLTTAAFFVAVAFDHVGFYGEVNERGRRPVYIRPRMFLEASAG